MDAVPETFGERLLRARRQAGLTQDVLGAKVGVTGNTISRLERGHSVQLTPDMIRHLARVLRITLDWLFAVEAPDSVHPAPEDSSLDEEPRMSLIRVTRTSVHV